MRNFGHTARRGNSRRTRSGVHFDQSKQKAVGQSRQKIQQEVAANKPKAPARKVPAHKEIGKQHGADAEIGVLKEEFPLPGEPGSRSVFSPGPDIESPLEGDETHQKQDQEKDEVLESASKKPTEELIQATVDLD